MGEIGQYYYLGMVMGILAIFAGLTASAGTKTKDMFAHAGTTAKLICPVNPSLCGKLHSVKWYKDTSRIYVFSQSGKVNRSEGNAKERMKVVYDETGPAILEIENVHIEDEAIYKCEITYVVVKESCHEVVQIVNLTTLVTPENVRILGIDGVAMNNGSILGPKDEGEEVDLICEAGRGKPIPRVTWYNGSTAISRAQYTKNEQGDGSGTGTSKLQLTLSRGDLKARFECHVESEALNAPIISWITADVHVKPTNMQLSGVKNHVTQGNNVMLICDVFGAKPPATIRWMNGSVPITSESLVSTDSEENSKIISKPAITYNERDGTFNTKSQLVFEATHYENGMKIHCYAENEVTKHKGEPEGHRVIILEVRYPPVIIVWPKNITINETTSLTNPKNGTLLICRYKANPQELLDAFWTKDGKNLSLSDSNKFSGGTKENPPLIIYNASRDDMGEYSCWLKNDIGMEQSPDKIWLNVQYPPDVEVIMDPSTPVKALDKTNVLLQCNVTSGNPSNLSKVRWFLDGELMKEFPECNYTTKDDSGGQFCGLDPSVLSLERVDAVFAGNYTCQGENVAGWGPISEPVELIVHYPPSPAKLRSYPSKVVKGGEVTLECKVDSTGRPENVTYLWYRGSHQMTEITAGIHKISPVGLETNTNFTCIAINEGGQSEPATLFINVNAPPALFDRLKPYQGILYSSEHINLTCRVECSPLCNIIWKKNGKIIDFKTNILYRNETKFHKPDQHKNMFESVESTLIWNMKAWPGNKLNRTAPNSNYTCQSESNQIGPGVSSNIEIAVDYPPEDVYVSTKVVNVIEGQSPNPVKCHGKGHPNLKYKWKNNATAEPKEYGEELRLGSMARADSGTYICEASNKHGTETAIVYLNVMYAPECSITRTEKDGSSALLCTVQANPQEISFFWKAREGNETYIVDNGNVIPDGLRSFLILDTTVDTKRTYQCYANNSVGFSDKQPCEIDVAGTLPWYKRLTKENLYIIIASIIALIICVIIICIVIIVLCRRKRAHTKSPIKPSSTVGDKIRPGIVPQIGNMQEHHHHPSNNIIIDPNDKGFYENLPFHGIQNPPNKPVSIIAPFNQRSINLISASSQKSLLINNNNPFNQTFHATTECINNSSLPKQLNTITSVKRHQSFAGFQFRNVNNNNNNNNRKGNELQLPSATQYSIFMRNINQTLFGGSTPRNFRTPLESSRMMINIKQHNNNNDNIKCSSSMPIPEVFNLNPDFQNNQYYQPLNCKPSSIIINHHHQRVSGRNEASFALKKAASEQKLTEQKILSENKKIILTARRFNSLKTQKHHKCYSPTFYSWRCKKHAKKRPVVYALSKKCLNNLQNTKESSDFENLTDSIQILEQNGDNNNDESNNNTKEITPTPAPRCKKHNKRPEIIYANICDSLSIGNKSMRINASREDTLDVNPPSSNNNKTVEIVEVEIHNAKIDDDENNQNLVDENDKKPKLVDHSPKFVAFCPKQQTTTTSLPKISPQAMKNSPVLKVSPNFIKPKVESPKGALSLKIQAKRKLSPVQNSIETKRSETTTSSTSASDLKENNATNIPANPENPPKSSFALKKDDDNQNAFYTLTASHHCKLPIMPPQYSATIPHHNNQNKHSSSRLMPKALFQEQLLLGKSKSFTSKSSSLSKNNNKRHHFQIPLQKCHSFKFQTAESYFQPIKNIHEENLMRNGYAGISNDFPSAAASSANSTNSLHHKKTATVKHKSRDTTNNPKQKTKGPLVLRHPINDYHQEQFSENIQNSVQLQYPQPGRASSSSSSLSANNNKPKNGVIQYADLDMPVINNSGGSSSRKSSHESSSSNSIKSQNNKKQKGIKTEYATLRFNEIGQEIDV